MTDFQANCGELIRVCWFSVQSLTASTVAYHFMTKIEFLIQLGSKIITFDLMETFARSIYVVALDDDLFVQYI